ncbi:MAG: PTS sugar transporter subunit IIA [Xanthomonadales bacterium]|nr:PTS sugar transporter subunit IIA [Xanthomonadales bacterium]
MRFIDLLPAERVRAGLAVRDKAELMERLAGLLAGDGEIAPVREALLARERLGTTALGHGVAIPHGRSASLDGARAAFVRLAEPIGFGAGDGRGVDLVAALIVPAHFTDQHLKLLAELAEIFSDPATTGALRNAADAPALRHLLAHGHG